MKGLFRKQLFLAMALLFSAVAWAQPKKVTGTVIDHGGKPMAGVSVTIKNSTTGTQTNDEGNFSIEASPSDVLIFSSVGFRTVEQSVGTESEMMIILESETDKLDEVVVVGYGSQNRSKITTAVSKMDDQVLKDIPRANIGSALQGSLTGIQVTNTTGQPGATPQIIMRGGASINSPGGPLVVVDGIIRSYSDIPAEDIESIQLLKDAAATAIYGARANNGVLLITTKKGKAGHSAITYKYSSGFNHAREGYKFLDAHDYIYYNRMGNLNSGRALSAVNASLGYGLRTDSAFQSTYDIKQYNSTTASLLGQGWDTVGDPYGGTIIFKNHGGEVENLVFRNTRTQDHYISAVGGNEKGQYYTSFDYYKENGIIVGSDYRRFSTDLKGSYKIKPTVQVNSGVSQRFRE